jgi:hypothetical protein
LWCVAAGHIEPKLEEEGRSYVRLYKEEQQSLEKSFVKATQEFVAQVVKAVEEDKIKDEAASGELHNLIARHLAKEKEIATLQAHPEPSVASRPPAVTGASQASAGSSTAALSSQASAQPRALAVLNQTLSNVLARPSKPVSKPISKSDSQPKAVPSAASSHSSSSFHSPDTQPSSSFGSALSSPMSYEQLVGSNAPAAVSHMTIRDV